MKKLGSGSRATFISPYLRRPLRSLNVVMGERGEEGPTLLTHQIANDEETGSDSVTWPRHRKSAMATE